MSFSATIIGANSRRIIPGFFVSVLLLSGCGTRVEDAQRTSESLAANASPSPVSGRDVPGVSPAEGENSAETKSVSNGAPRSTGGPVQNKSTGTVRSDSAGTAPLPRTQGSAPAPRDSKPGTVETKRGGEEATSAGPVTPAPQTTPSDRSPIEMASVGTYSGPAGAALIVFLRGAQLWVQTINGRGGVNGHIVRLTVYDNGGDPARHQFQVRDAVERRHVLGFLMNAEVLSQGVSADYLKERRVAVIGLDGGADWAATNPMYFPQTPNGALLADANFGSIAQQALALGKKKVAAVSCIEAKACDEGHRVGGEAEKFGMELVYRARASIAQPDFTAECLAARRAGAEVFFLWEPPEPVRRIVLACARQGYKPIFAIPSVGIDSSMSEDPNFEGALSVSNVAPFFQSNTPATSEYQRALATVGKGLAPSGNNVVGWVAGKLLEKAAAQMPEPPTSEALLRGLWTIRNDDLGGLTYPLTFPEEQPAPQRACWFNLRILKGTWVSPDNFKLQCR